MQSDCTISSPAPSPLKTSSPHVGIMTLTRAPCELDTMSLFQDLKLKRRKVDSRCSSDGESVADTSTSSPDVVPPGSPCKMDPPASPPAIRAASPDSILPDEERENKGRSWPVNGLGPAGERLKSVIEDGRGSPREEIRVKAEPPPWARMNGVKESVKEEQQPLVHSVFDGGGGVGMGVCRINGVRPELIGGSPGSGVAVRGLRPAPTVIMGEAGGVRTMVWSQPAPPPAPSPAAPTTSGSWSHSQEETAAQLLLTLAGQQQGGGSGGPGSGCQGVVSGSGGDSGPPGPTSNGSRQLNMERLWAGDLSQLPPSQQMTALNLTSASLGQGGLGGGPPQSAPVWGVKTQPPPNSLTDPEVDEDEQPMVCMICEDKATGLHYGIITCEGCKGFFKRTVQNRRVYTCVADGTCEITKAQRNRCQYCRFKKCIEQGMVLQAVREDRMPGGRNSGAVYNLYKVKYKKHKKSVRNGQIKQETKGLKPVINAQDHSQVPPHIVNGTILKTALTNPSEVVHLRQRLDNTVTSSRDRHPMSMDHALSMIQSLIDCDEFQDIATLRNLDDLLEHKSDLSDKLMQIGDSIVYKLVQWTKRLPFYLELPVEVHTRLLTHKWHELLVLTTSAYQAIHGAHKLASTSSDGTEAHFTQEVSNNLCTLQTCLTSMMGRPISIDQLRQDVGLMVEKITHVTLMFRRIKLSMQEYVCLKVIIMLNPARGSTSELEVIQERYMSCLRTYVEHTSPNVPNRFHDLLMRLPEVQSAASLLLESKMFYVPFLLNSAIQR